ncbi:DUF5110 domain-containing protein [Chitinophaga horti]|uniref:DUF5110 domain-containing protein n=1 Tax=Chitinophaga horti TaxID=2920382 RepID=A0ABY6J963_9BACT|nr:TIM-barrel domain-containing protein [Chitinophaga horti]UYQ94862.1 DUF5110 domain-containing protein [Chitinophaga horti]
MKISMTGLLVLIVLFSFRTQPGKVEKLPDGLLIQLASPTSGGARQVKLQVVSDKIIHVTASAGDTFSQTPSLMVVTTGVPGVKWESTEDADKVTLKTASLTASVQLSSGEVTFRDADGKLILQEKAGGGKSFRAAASKGLYAIKQTFESPEDEAFYGLGQPQTGLMNYKDKDVDLTQYNAIAAVPFLVSSRNYGILWDNYAITRFGDDRKPRAIGELGDVEATYSVAGKVHTARQEQDIAYTYIESLQGLPKGFPLAKGKVVWEGKLTPAENGLYKFYTTASGYIKIWVDGQLRLDRWRESWNPGPSIIEAQTPHQLKIEWIPESDQSFFSINWLGPSAELKDKMSLSSEAAEKIDYYFVHGQNLDEVIGGYRTLTGKASLLPNWALGFWQSRERYKTQDEILQTVKTFREKKIPLDNIVLDWSYWKEDAWGSQQFDEHRFPDAKGMIGELHQKYHTHFMISVWPKFYEGIPNYKLFDEKGWLYKQNIADKQRDWIGKGYVSTFYDAFHPGARKLFWQLMDQHLFSKGVDAWWLDASEPDIYSNSSIQHRKTLMGPTALGPAEQYFNGYTLMNAKGVYEGQRATNNDQRVFILTRTAFPGLQRYGAASWSGDIAARFDEMERQIPAGLNMSLSGLPYWTTDIGGFFVENKYDQPAPKGEALTEWRELNTRWFQYGAFCPLFRSHGQFPYREVFNIAPEGSEEYKSMVYYNRLRYRLMPYIYSLAGHTHHKDYTMMRALVMDFPQDTAVRSIGDQFMFGPSLLVNPVYNYKARQRRLYLPAGSNWYDFYSGKHLTGGQSINADAPLGRLPLYVRDGSIIPAGPAIQYTGEKRADTLTLFVYGGRDASFELYEDEGVNYQYEKGQFSSIPFRYNEADKVLQIGDRTGSFPGMGINRLFRVVYIHPKQAKGFDPEMTTSINIKYNGKAQTQRL